MSRGAKKLIATPFALLPRAIQAGAWRSADASGHRRWTTRWHLAMADHIRRRGCTLAANTILLGLLDRRSA